MSDQPKSELRGKALEAVEAMLADELTTLRRDLIARVDDNSVSMLDFMEGAIQFWRHALHVDRIFVVDMRSGEVVAGWNKGLNVARLQDWDGDYVPLENDRVIQHALESDEPVAAPTPGQGADLAFALPLDDGAVWLVAMDQTDLARSFSQLDMAYVALVRDLAVIKSRLRPAYPQ